MLDRSRESSQEKLSLTEGTVNIVAQHYDLVVLGGFLFCDRNLYDW